MPALAPRRSRPRPRPRSCAGAGAFGRSCRHGEPGTQIPRRGRAVSGRRYYSPSQGRFLGRDPIQERGGLNLYGFSRNNAVNFWDVLGMAPSHDGDTGDTFEEETADDNGVLKVSWYCNGGSSWYKTNEVYVLNSVTVTPGLNDENVAPPIDPFGLFGGTGDDDFAPNSGGGATTNSSSNLTTYADLGNGAAGVAASVLTGTGAQMAAREAALGGAQYPYRGISATQLRTMAQNGGANAANVATLGRVLKVGGATLGVGLAGVDVYRGGASSQSLARGTVGVIGTATAFIPVVGPFISLGISITNAAGGFDRVYNYFDNTPSFGNRPGQPGGGG